MFTKTFLGAVLALALASVSFAGGNYGGYYGGSTHDFNAAGGGNWSGGDNWASGSDYSGHSTGWSQSGTTLSGGAVAGQDYGGWGQSHSDGWIGTNSWGGVEGLCGCEPRAYTGSNGDYSFNASADGSGDAGGGGTSYGDSYANFDVWNNGWETHNEWNNYAGWLTWDAAWGPYHY